MYDIQQNTLIGLGIFERNISFHAFDLADMFNKPVLWKPIRDLISAGLASGEIKPLCTNVYDTIEPALRCISQGKHIGKVVVRVQDPGNRVANNYTDSEISKFAKQYYSTSGTHIVVGGLGGFGLEMVNWLYNRGAERIVIISRGNPKPHQLHLLRGNRTVVDHSDLTNVDQCNALCESLGGALEGVWHLGMVLNDRLYSNMTEQAWNETVNVKAVISKNLDIATRKYNANLKQFVMWSSVSALFGNPGQTNYAYANAYMENVCMNRKVDGLCGVAVQWGFIGNVGVLAGAHATAANSTLAFLPQNIDSCLESLSVALFAQSSHAVVTSYLRKSSDIATADANGGAVPLTQRIARVLGIELSKIKPTDTLASLGMDSLQSVEITNILKAANVYKKITDLRSTSWTDLSAL